MKCEFCEGECTLPFKCPFCTKYFCSEHRLPENHRCPDYWKAKIRPPPRRGTVSIETEAPDYYHAETLGTGASRKRKFVALAIVFLFIGMGIGYLVSIQQTSTLQLEISNLKSQISNLQSEISASYTDGYTQGYQLGYGNGNQSGYELGYVYGYDNGTETGFANGYIQGVEDGAGKGYTIRDPTFDEAIAFVISDKTNENKPSEDYVCYNFAADFENNAFQAGYRCGFVYVEFVEGAHAIICFNTIDEGSIFVEPQDDDMVTLTIGQPYWDRTKYEVDYDDTVVRFIIIW